MNSKLRLEREEFYVLLRDGYHQRNAELGRKFARNLPFQDAMFDRWERARELGFGENASIYNSALVFGEVRVGENTWVGPYTVLDGSGGSVSVGSWCSISAGVHIYTHDTVAWALSGGLVQRALGSVSIGDCCFIGPESIITRGVNIGSRSVVGANSFVNRDVPARTVVGGSPAVVLGRVEGEGEQVRIVMSSTDREPVNLGVPNALDLSGERGTKR